MDTRKIVVLTNGERDITRIIQNHPESSQITLAVPTNMKPLVEELSDLDHARVSFFYYSDDANIPTAKNEIINAFYDLDTILHIIEDDMVVVSTAYYDSIEILMQTLKIGYWCNTATNPNNMIYTKLSPRFIIKLDRYALDGIDEIQYMAHESNEHIAFNFCRLNDRPKFNEALNLLYNIEYIYSHKQKYANQIYFNFYPTFSNETKYFYRDNDHFEKKSPEFESIAEKIKNEEKIMKDLNIEWVPHTTVDDLIYWVETSIIKQDEKNIIKVGDYNE
jgi:hypothetical protein